jgi:hypothetical protein
MAALRPAIEELLEPSGGQRPSGWSFYAVALDSYVGGRFEQSRDYADRGLELAREASHDYAVATLAAYRLLAATAADGAIEQQQLLDVLKLIERPQVQPLMVLGLWFAARYAAGVEEFATAAALLARAEAIRAAVGLDLWPEEVLRDETLSLLGEAEAPVSPDPEEPLPAGAVAAPVALADAMDWLAGRPDGEIAARAGARRSLFED